MRKFKEFIKNNITFKLIMIIGFILLLIQMNQVVLYADDFSLGLLVKNKTNIFEYFINHYKTWGGGYTGCIVIMFLKTGVEFWKFLNTLLISLMVYFGTKMITYKNSKNKNIVATVLWGCVFSLGIYVSKESIYWLDGSCAYILSTFLMFAFIYLIYSKLIIKTKIKKWDYILLPFIAFFSGWSSAQTGIISLIIVMIIAVYAKFKNKEKIKILIWISIALCVIGCLIFYLSPGNSSRMQEFQEYANLNIGQKIMYRAREVYSLLFDYESYEPYELPFYTILLIRTYCNCRNSDVRERK